MIQLDYRDSRPIYTQIIDGIREQITAGILQPGEKLPSVRELAAVLAINPNTIQRSYRCLELDGWIATVPGKGCFVCSTHQTQAREKERLLDIFDSTVESLEKLGITQEMLRERMNQGGKPHA